MASVVKGAAVVSATETEVERAQKLGDARIPTQRLPPTEQTVPVRKVSARRRRSAAWWVIPGIAGTAVVAAQTWLVVEPLLDTSSTTDIARATDCVPQDDLYDVQIGMTRQGVLEAFSSAGRIDQYTPRQSLEVIYRSCAPTAPWTRLLYVAYVWEQGEWRVAELHKGVAIVEAS